MLTVRAQDNGEKQLPLFEKPSGVPFAHKLACHACPGYSMNKTSIFSKFNIINQQ